MKKRIISALLLIALLIGAAACAEDGPENKTDPVATTAAVSVEGDESAAETLRVEDFHAEDFIILTNNLSNDYKSREFTCQFTNGDTLNDAVYARNCKIENLYNVTLVPLAKSGEADALKTSVDVDDREYDIALLKLQDAGPLGISGYLADFNEMPNVKLEGSWWDQNSVSDLSIGNRLFMTVGDLNICDKDMTWCLFFNKKIATDRQLPDMFELAREKKWTFEKFQKLCEDITSDLNGDGVFNGSDQWGHVTVFARSTIAYMFSMNTFFITKDQDDLPILQVDEKFNTTFEKIISFFGRDNMCLDVQAIDREDFDNQWRKSEDMFMNNQVLFYAEAMQNAERFRGSENDFGILPLPSANEGEYGRHFVWREAYITVMPADIVADEDRYDRNTLLLEAIQRASAEDVLPAYYEISLKGRLARDVQSATMIDIIFGSRYYDIASYYGWGNLSGTIQSLGKSMTKSYSSTLKMILSIASKDIDKAIEAIEALD